MARSSNPSDLPTNLAERCSQIYFEATGSDDDAGIQQLCDANPDWATEIWAYRDSIMRGEGVLGHVARGLVDLESHPPKAIGPYRLLEFLGQGGFGVVYRAEQSEPVRRIVAIKLLRGAHHDERVRMRFEVERQTLARMQHTGIAQVFDAGLSEDGHPFLAMEYVDGLPLTTWCERHRLSIPDRLTLFAKVCAAIHHAHQRGVVHRDIKPGNILVRSESGDPIPKVIDFGVAKLLEVEHGHRPLSATREGAWIGTPSYMSPEQILGTTIDTRTDVYALGVLLFELLSSELPFSRTELSTASPAALARIVCETEPRSLSAALRSSSDPTTLVASRRMSSVDELQRLLRGDLNWLIRKALARDPDQRYPSVSELIQDIQRYSRNEPVSAREAAPLYVLRKFAGRHRLGVAVAGAVIAVSIAGLVTLLWFLSKLEAARSTAVDQQQIADRQRQESERNEYHAHIAAAQGALRLGMIGSARDHLLAGAPAHRGWEWRFLASQLDTSLSRHAGPGEVSQVQWLDDDRLLIGYYFHDAAIWNTRSGSIERTLPLRASNPRASLDADAGRLYPVVDSRWVEAWVAPDWSSGQTLFHSDSNISALELAPNASHLLVANTAGTVHRVDPLGESPAEFFFQAEDHVVDLKFFADGERVAVANFLGAVEVRDVASGSLIRTLAEDANFTALAVCEETVFGFGTRKIQAWHAQSGDTVARASTRQQIARMRISSDGRVLYGSGGFGAAEVSAWDTATLEVLGRFYGHQSGVLALDLHPDGTRIATGSRDYTARVWTSVARPSVRRLQAGFDARHLSVSPDGLTFACANLRGRVTAWDAVTLHELLTLETGLELRGCAMGANRVYAAGTTLVAVDVTTSSLTEGDAPTDFIDGLEIDDQERWLVGTGEGSNTVTIWALPELRLTSEFECPARPHLVFDPRTERFLIACNDGILRILDPARGRITETVPSPAPIYNLAVHGPWLAAASDQVHLQGPGPSPKPWDAHGFGTFGVAFSPGGQRIATGGGDYLTRLWSADGKELLVLEASQKPIIQVKFAANGSKLLGLSHTWHNPTEILVWEAPPSVDLDR